MSSTERRLFDLNDKLEAIGEEIRLVTEELSFHRHLADDAARDAAVYDDPIERENASLTSADVRRFEKRLAKLERQREKLQARRLRLLEKLA